MSWLEKLLPPKIQQTDPSERRSVPEGLWIKCPACETVLYKTDLEGNLNVCPKCEHHHRIGARARLDAFLDPEGRFEIGQEVARLASGYVYYVSLKGVTGAGHFDVSSVEQAMPRIRAHVKLPIGVGFGIRDAASARAVAQVADAVVIGSRLVQILEAEPRDNVAAAGRRFMAEIRTALDKSDQGNRT